jgi:hypothetical protein
MMIYPEMEMTLEKLIEDKTIKIQEENISILLKELIICLKQITMNKNIEFPIKNIQPYNIFISK